jgi:hypothetical protein
MVPVRKIVLKTLPLLSEMLKIQSKNEEKFVLIRKAHKQPRIC